MKNLLAAVVLSASVSAFASAPAKTETKPAATAPAAEKKTEMAPTTEKKAEAAPTTKKVETKKTETASETK
jgi:hypothetical protein